MDFVLLVDDSPVLRVLLRDVLRRAGIGGEVVEAGSAEAALASLERSGVPGLVLCDLGLPGTDGVELVRALRARRDPRAPRILALCVAGDADGPRRAREAGADGCLEKPFTPEALRAALDACAGRSSAPVAGASRAR